MGWAGHVNTPAFSQAITLYITPVIFIALDRFSGRGPVLTPEHVEPGEAGPPGLAVALPQALSKAR